MIGTSDLCEFCRKADGTHAPTCYSLLVEKLEEFLSRKEEK